MLFCLILDVEAKNIKRACHGQARRGAPAGVKRGVPDLARLASASPCAVWGWRVWREDRALSAWSGTQTRWRLGEPGLPAAEAWGVLRSKSEARMVAQARRLVRDGGEEATR